MEKIYITGNASKKDKALLRELGFDAHSGIERSNNLAERIDVIRKSNFIIAEVDNNNVGSSVEIGQIMEFNWFRDNISSILTRSGDKDLRSNLEKFLKEYPHKFVYCHTTDTEDKGMCRSLGINQYLYSVCLELNKLGVLTFDEIITHIKYEMREYIKYSAFEFDGLELNDDYFKDKTNKELSEMCDRYNHLWSK